MRSHLILAVFLSSVGAATPAPGQTTAAKPAEPPPPAACTGPWLKCLGQRFRRLVGGVDQLAARPEVREGIESVAQITDTAWFQAFLQQADSAAAALEGLNGALAICDTLTDTAQQQACRDFVYAQARTRLTTGVTEQTLAIARWLGEQSVAIEEKVWPKIQSAAAALRAAYADGRAAAAAEKAATAAERERSGG